MLRRWGDDGDVVSMLIVLSPPPRYKRSWKEERERETIAARWDTHRASHTSEIGVKGQSVYLKLLLSRVSK